MSSKPKKVKKHPKNVCRTCLLKHRNTCSIFDIDKTLNVGYNTIVTSVTGIEIKKDDNLTMYICPACKQNAKSAYVFIKQAKEAEKSLREGIKHIKIKKEKDQSKKHKKRDAIVDVKMENYDAIVKSENTFDDDDFDDGYTSPLDNTVLSEIKKYEVAIEDCKPMIIKTEGNYCPICRESFENAFNLINHSCMCSIIKSSEVSSKPKNLLKIGKVKTPSHTKKSKISIKIKNRPAISVERVPTKATKKRSQSKKEEVEFTLNFDGILRCGICNMLVDQYDLLMKHFNKHAGLTVRKCSVCDKLFMEQMYLQKHSDACHPGAPGESDANYTVASLLHTAGVHLHLSICPICGELLMTLDNLNQHNATMHPEFVHQCKSCHMVFKDEASIAKHTKNCLGKTLHACDICGMKFARAQHLQSHVKLKHLHPRPDAKPGQLKCNICDNSYHKLAELEKHKYRWHKPLIDGKILYECDVCHYRSDSKYNLGTHLNNVHFRFKPREAIHQCQFCGKRTTSQGNLKVHIRRHHTGEKPYKCNYCDKHFVRSLDRNMHERTHTGYKPYSCQYCGWSFAKSSALKQHIRVHTGEKPYKCCHCGQGFAQCHDKTKHERRHTGEVAYSCVCGHHFLKARDLHSHRLTCGVIAAQSVDPEIAHMKRQMEQARNYIQSVSLL